MGLRAKESLASSVVGASAIEYTLALALVSLAALGAFMSVGDAIEVEVDCVAAAVAGGAAGPCTPSAVAGAAGSRSTRGRHESLAAAPAPQSDLESTKATIAASVGALWNAFDEVAGGDDVVSMDELAEHARRHPSSEAAEAYRALAAHPGVRYALDVGAGRGSVDGKISREDMQRFNADVRFAGDGELYDLLADTASGEGGRDHYVSGDDARAVLGDPIANRSMQSHAEYRLEYIAAHGEDPPCHGWLGCNLERAKNAGSVLVHTVTDAALGIAEPWMMLRECAGGDSQKCERALLAAAIATSIALTGPVGWSALATAPILFTVSGQFMTDDGKSALGRIFHGWGERVPLVVDPNRDRDSSVRGVGTRRARTPHGYIVELAATLASRAGQTAGASSASP